MFELFRPFNYLISFNWLLFKSAALIGVPDQYDTNLRELIYPMVLKKEPSKGLMTADRSNRMAKMMSLSTPAGCFLLYRKKIITLARADQTLGKRVKSPEHSWTDFYVLPYPCSK